jgi:O-antigen/teichoic acid export membrane protein
LAATLPLAAVVIVFAPQVMKLFGTEFEAGWPVLVIATFGQIVNCAVGSVGYLLLMSGNQKRLVKVQFAAAIVSVLVNLCLIPVLGIVGAAIAAALVNSGTNLWNLLEVRRALRLSPYNRGYYKLLFPAGLMMISLAVLRVGVAGLGQQWLLLLLALLISYGIFGGAVFAFGLDNDDKSIAADLLGNFRSGLQRLG